MAKLEVRSEKRVFEEPGRIYSERLESWLRDSIRLKEELLRNIDFLESFGRAAEKVVQAYQAGGRLYIAGNGGSAADAQHLAAEFVSKLARDRAPIPAEALTVDTSLLTAIGNDYGFEEVFARKIAAKMGGRDLFLGITTSGESKNLIRALEECRSRKLGSIIFSGRSGGRVKGLADICVVVPGRDTSQIQEAHIVLYHTLCACVEQAMYPV